MAVLGEQIDRGEDAHAALAFLATAIKDHGAISASIELHRSAEIEHSFWLPFQFLDPV